MGLVGTFLLALVKAIVLVWGTLTNWAYRIIHDSTEVVKAYSKVHRNGVTCMRLIVDIKGAGKSGCAYTGRGHICDICARARAKDLCDQGL